MIEVPVVLFSLLVEGFVALLIVISVYVFILKKQKNKETEAIKKLVEQIKVQSDIRMQKTGSFLSEKYRFEGDELDKAVKTIDQSEKKFMQKLVNVYHKRDIDGLLVMDACVAELIESFKELSPVMPDSKILAEMATGENEQTETVQEEIADLKRLNENLTEELTITKKTMGNMIAEFGNMFGGGKEHELENKKVIEKVIEASGNTAEIAHVGNPEPEPAPIQQDQIEDILKEESKVDDIKPAESDSNELEIEELSDQDVSIERTLEVEHIEADQSDKVKKEQEVKKQAAKPDEIFDEGIDDLIDGIDLSDESL